MRLYSDPRRESDPHALPNVEVWQATVGVIDCPDCHREDDEVQADCPYCIECGQKQPLLPDVAPSIKVGWFYTFGFPGCRPDGDTSGPYETFDAAIADARCGNECDDAPCGEWSIPTESHPDECSACGWSHEAHKEGSN